MPCNSDYMNPTQLEIELSKVCTFLDELETGKLRKSYLRGYHPKVYGQPFSTNDADELVSSLCSKLQKLDVKQYSLELQIWWRDHQAADKKRIKKELAREKTEKEKQAAWKKLTPYEQKLLGRKSKE